MKNKISKLTTIAIAILSGCNDYSYNAYSKPSLPLLESEIRIEIVGTYQDVDEEKRTYEWGNPYYVWIGYRIPEGEEITGFKARAAELRAKESGEVIPLEQTFSRGPSTVSRLFGDTEGGLVISVTLRPERELPVPYQDYLLQCELILSKDGEVVHSEEIQVELNKAFRRVRRLDLFERVMGI